MSKRKRKKPLKLTNKFEIFFYKYKWLIVAFLLLNCIPSNYDIGLLAENSLLGWTALGTLILVVSIVLILMPTYRKVYSRKEVWSNVFIIVLISTLANKNILLHINGKIGTQRIIKENMKVIGSYKSYYKGHPKYKIRTLDENNQKNSFKVSEKLYNEIKVGDNYEIVWKKGLLGISYLSHREKEI